MASAKTINDCRRIVLGGNPSTEIKRVVYCDPYGTPHNVWPGGATVGNVYIEELSSGSATRYYVSGSTPSIVLKPETDYAIKCDINIHDPNPKYGTIETLTDCYMYHHTGSSGQPVVWSNRGNSNGSPTYTRYAHSTENAKSQYCYFAVYTADDTPSAGYCDLNVQGAFLLSDCIDLAQYNFIADSNFSTPVILRRAPVTESKHFYTDNTNNPNNVLYGTTSMLVGDTITIYPKYHKHASDNSWSGDWDKYEFINFDSISYDSTYFSVVHNNNGSYTITANTSTNTALKYISFTKGGVSDSFGFVIDTNIDYRAKWGNTVLYDGASITVSAAGNIGLEVTNNALDPTPTWTTYTGPNSSITENGSNNRLSISGNTITPVAFGTTTSIKIIIENKEMDVNVTIPAMTTYYYGAGVYDPMSGTTTVTSQGQLTNNVTLSFSGASTQSYTPFFGIIFATDGNLTTGYNALTSSSWTTQGGKTLVSSQQSGTIGHYEFALNNSLTSGSDSVTITASNGATITITLTP